jgi:hypothetical protein
MGLRPRVFPAHRPELQLQVQVQAPASSATPHPLANRLQTGWMIQHCSDSVTGAGASPRGHCRLAACPGRVGSSVAGSAAKSSALITLRSHQPLLCASVQVSSPVRFLGASPLGAPTTSVSATASTPPHRPIKLFAYSYFGCRRRGSPCLLPLRPSVTPPRVRRTAAVNRFHLRTTV